MLKYPRLGAVKTRLIPSLGKEQACELISIIIPALNEAQNLPQTLEAAQRGHPYEIIVVDGGSTDQTVEMARSMDAIVLSAPRGRAQQMNHGAAIATGEYLLFLHADTLLPSDYPVLVLALLNQPGVAGGAFTFAISGDFVGRRLVECTTNWRARRWQLPYGDQALFLRRETFAHLGGFREMPIMEDYEFVRRLRRTGRIVIAPSTAMTSGRRWQKFGGVRTTLLNKAMILGYHLGVPPSCLAAWYRGERADRATRSWWPELNCERPEASGLGRIRAGELRHDGKTGIERLDHLSQH